MSTSPPQGPSNIPSPSLMGLVQPHPPKMSIMSLANYTAASQTRHVLCGFFLRTRNQVVVSQPGQPQARSSAAAPPDGAEPPKAQGTEAGRYVFAVFQRTGREGVFDIHQTAGTMLAMDAGLATSVCIEVLLTAEYLMCLTTRHTTSYLMHQSTLFLMLGTFRTSGALTHCQTIQPVSQWTIPPA